MYTNICRLLCKKCDVGYYATNHGVMKLMIAGYSVYSFNFIITQNSYACQNKIHGVVAYTFLNVKRYTQKKTGFCLTV